MKVTVPICSAEEALAICESKDVELFCGYLPSWMSEICSVENQYVKRSLNNRLRVRDNICDFEELKSIVRIAGGSGADISLTLNSRIIGDSQYDCLDRYIAEILEAGIKRVIVADYALINHLRLLFPQLMVTVSCLAQVTNSSAVRYVQNIDNVSRVVLPRHMASNEVRKLAKDNPGMQFEFFIFSNKCLFDDGFCRALHTPIPICRELFQRRFFLRQGRIGLHDVLWAESNWTAYQHWTTEYENAETRTLRRNHFACSACATSRFYDIPNIVSGKLSIRGHRIDELLTQLGIAKRALQLASVHDQEGIRELMCEVFDDDSFCENGFNCIMPA